MSSIEATRVVTVQDPIGLHVRPAEVVAKTAMRFVSRIEIVCEGHRVDAKSILEILTLGATQGSELSIEAVGDDAPDAADAVAVVVKGEFEETS